MLRAKSAGWVVKGTEPDALAAAQAARNGLDVFAGDCRDLRMDASFDVITLAHVVEHLHEPFAVLEDCHRLLKPGGRIWIATPNIHSIGHRLFKEAWQPLEVPRHLVMPSAEALAGMLGRAGFTNIRFRRRGHGSRKRIGASAARGRKLGMGTRSVSFWSLLIDIRASFLAKAGEELVVTADRAVI
jgi:SAM-dependent methyltransferase